MRQLTRIYRIDNDHTFIGEQTLQLLKNPHGKSWTTAVKLVHHEQRNGMPNGRICLKGGELQAEIRPYKRIVEVQDLYPTFSEEYFKTKKVVYLPL